MTYAYTIDEIADAYDRGSRRAYAMALPDPLPALWEAKEDVAYIEHMFRTQQRLWDRGERTPGTPEEWECSLAFAERVLEEVREKSKQAWHRKKLDAEQRNKEQLKQQKIDYRWTQIDGIWTRRVYAKQW
jgi:hypothetical protein